MKNHFLCLLLSALLPTLCARHASADNDVVESVTNSIDMTFVWIDVKGRTQPGAPDVIQTLASRIEKPGYYIGMHEVTQAAFSRVSEDNPSVFAKSGKLRRRVEAIDTDRLPVDSVSWHDASDFCTLLSDLPDEREAGRRYRLPTAAEWEFAARAGSKDLWCFGSDRKRLTEYAWFGFDRADQRPHHVGRKKPNSFGLYDMYGNVWEWCADLDPRNPIAESDVAADGARIIRGGGWMSEPRHCNSVYWEADPPSVGDYDTGFRVVMEID